MCGGQWSSVPAPGTGPGGLVRLEPDSAPGAGGLDQPGQRLAPPGAQFQPSVEVSLRLGLAPQEQQRQAAPPVCSEVTGVDANVFAAVLQHLLGALAPGLVEDANDLTRRQRGVDA